MSKAQLKQDVWVLDNSTRAGYFLEIGAFHPEDLSNTWLLEQKGWRGVAVEPMPNGDWTTRPNTTLIQEVITSDGRDVTFVSGNELGGIEEHISYHAKEVKDKPRVNLSSITPSQLLERVNAPRTIDYLSLDTEGSELEILSHFPFEEYTVRLITVEHNFEEPKRSQIRQLLERQGFVLDQERAWDDFYVRNTGREKSMTYDSIVYVVAHTQELVDQAKTVYTDPIFRPILLPKSPFMESVMYTDYLLSHEDEWKNCDYVGCVGYASHKKQPNVFHVDEIFKSASKENANLVAFLYRGDPLLQTAAKWHTPAFLEAWLAAWRAMGISEDESVLLNDDGVSSFYCNYWATRPNLMKEYCLMMKRLADKVSSDKVSSDPDVKRVLWKDSTYHARGSDIAKLTTSQCQDLFGVPYYPMLGFVCERLPCMWFSRLRPTSMLLLR